MRVFGATVKQAVREGSTEAVKKQDKEGVEVSCLRLNG